jgi:protein-disulfide isomerase
MRLRIIVLTLVLTAFSIQLATGQQRQPGARSEDCCTLELPGLTGTPPSSGLTFPSDRLVEGNAQSRIRVLVFEDLQCPDCARFRKLLDETLLPKYGEHVAFEIYDFPLPKHHWARSAAAASRYLQRLAGSTAMEFRRSVAESLSQINEEGFESFFRDFLRSKSLDVRSAIRSLSDPELNRAVEADFQEGLKRDVRKTPTVVVGSRLLVEQFSGEEIATELDRIVSLGGPTTHQQRSPDQKRR